jgi:hypothetical protein
MAADPAVDQVSIARLHGEACWDCGAVTTTLYPAGAVTTEAGKEWEIRKCGSHLKLPPMSELSEQQVRGTACVYCGIHLDNADAIDLGERRASRAGIAVRWFPRACPQHGGEA